MLKISKVKAVNKQGNSFRISVVNQFKINDISFVLLSANTLIEKLHNDIDTPKLLQDEGNTQKVYPMVHDGEKNNLQLRPLTDDESEIIKLTIEKYNQMRKQNSTLLELDIFEKRVAPILELVLDIDISNYMFFVSKKGNNLSENELNNLIRQINERISDLEQEEYLELEKKLLNVEEGKFIDDDEIEENILNIISYLCTIDNYKQWVGDGILKLQSSIDLDSDLDSLLYVLNSIVNLSVGKDINKELLGEKIQFIIETYIDNKIVKKLLTKLIEKKEVECILPAMYLYNERFKCYIDEVKKIAEVLYDKEDYPNAVQTYLLIEQYIGDDKNNNEYLSDLHNSLGCCYIELNLFDEAEESFEKSIKFNKHNAAAHNNLAYICSEIADSLDKGTDQWKSKMQTALIHIQSAIVIKDDVIYFNNQMHIEYELGNYEKILDIWDAATEFDYKYKDKDKEGMYFLYILSNLELYEIKKEDIYLNEATEKLEFLYNINPTYFEIYTFLLDSLKLNNISKDMLHCLVRIVFLIKKIKENLELPKNIKDVAYYTSIKNLYYILNDELEKEKYRIPIFDSNYMNDPNEGILLCQFLESKIKTFKNPNTVAKANIRSTWNEEFVFLKSFSFNIDSLPMWVNYGDKGKGCCVIINKDTFINPPSKNEKEEKTFETQNSNDDYTLHRVVYFDGKTIDENEYPKLQPLIDSLLDALNILFSYSENWDNDTSNQINIILDNYLSRIKYLFKHNDYKYEKEARVILYRDKNGSLSDVITTTGSFPQLYLYLKNQIQIDEIILGPKVKKPNNYVPFIKFKLHNMENDDCVISTSSIEFR